MENQGRSGDNTLGGAAGCISEATGGKFNETRRFTRGVTEPGPVQRGIGGAPTRASILPTEASERKKFPVASGVLDYFPDAIAAVANVSWQGNEQHNPGQPLHWARGKSTDEADTMLRHYLQRGTRDVDGQRHTAKMVWRALALLQKEIEAEAENAQDRAEPAWQAEQRARLQQARAVMAKEEAAMAHRNAQTKQPIERRRITCPIDGEPNCCFTAGYCDRVAERNRRAAEGRY